jgi:membrane protease subunit HflC
MVLSPESEFFRYFGSNGELPAANTNLATPIQPTAAPITAPATDEPALDGLDIEGTTVPSITLEDGSELTPTVGTEVPVPAEEPAAAPAQ